MRGLVLISVTSLHRVY